MVPDWNWQAGIKTHKHKQHIREALLLLPRKCFEGSESGSIIMKLILGTRVVRRCKCGGSCSHFYGGAHRNVQAGRFEWLRRQVEIALTFNIFETVHYAKLQRMDGL